MPSLRVSLTCCEVILFQNSQHRPLLFKSNSPEPVEEQSGSPEDEGEEDQLDDSAGADPGNLETIMPAVEDHADILKSFEDAIDGDKVSAEWIEQRKKIVQEVFTVMKTNRPSRAADFDNYRTYARMFILNSKFAEHKNAKRMLVEMERVMKAEGMVQAADNSPGVVVDGSQS